MVNKMKGLYNDKYKHSLASKGIKSNGNWSIKRPEKTWGINDINIEEIIEECELIIQAGETNSVGGCNCGMISESIATMSDGGEFYGDVYDLKGNLMDEDHAWTILRDGTIIDASIGQFELGGFDIGKCDKNFIGVCIGEQTFRGKKYPRHKIAIIPKNHPQAKRYMSHFNKEDIEWLEKTFYRNVD